MNPSIARWRVSRKSGFTVLEILIASAVFAVVLAVSFGLITHDGHLSQVTLGISVAETRAQQMLHDLERELYNARGANPKASITVGLGSGATDELRVDSTLGFPDSGMLLLERGTPNEERIRYAGLGAGLTSFLALTRGDQCTTDQSHGTTIEVLWASLAEPIELQTAPAADLWDGRARERNGTVFFRGDGTGFSYRVPTDPAGGTDFLDGDDLQWGATVRGDPTLDGWAALVFVPRTQYLEAANNDDLNNDGDKTDVFDVGQIQKRVWNTADTTVLPVELGQGPTIVLQERCNWGGDLDADGFDDPIFLWDAPSRRLHVRLFVLGSNVSHRSVVRKVESLIFLRNEAEN